MRLDKIPDIKLSKNQKSFYLLLVIGVLTTSLVMFIQSELRAQDESQIETSELETYINAVNGFQFKYPKIYEAVPGCGLREKNNVIFLGNRIQIQVVDAPQGLTLDEYVNNYVNQAFCTDKGDKFESKSILIGGLPATVITYRIGGMGRYGETSYLLHFGKIFEFSYFAGPSCVDDVHELKALRDILNTFKFIDQ